MPKDTWRNRIIGYENVDPEQLLANPSNWRVHPKTQQAALEGALSEVGWVQDVIVNQRTGHLLDGHLRVTLALRRDEPTIPVKYVDLDEREEALVLATFDPISAMATADAAKLDELLREVSTGEAALQEMLAKLAEEAGVTWGDEPQGEAPEPQVDRASELQAKWGTATGQVWEIGAHRLAVGDCTDRAVVEAVMRGERAEMVWTDPPYGVAVGDKNKFLNSIARSNRIEENLENDTLDEPALAAMLVAAFVHAAASCLAGGAWYVAAPPGPLHVVFGQTLKNMDIWRQTIQWVKNNATFAPLGVDYHWQAEPIFYGWLPGAAHRFYGGRQQTTVWNIDRPTKSPEHPTMKPVELVERAIANSSQSGEIVYDPFTGSGTTLVACERLGRKGRGIEIAPGYAAVTLERLADMGLEPRLVETVDVAVSAVVSSPPPPRVSRLDVPDAIWPTDNDLGIPLLDLSMQSDALDLPVAKWGTVSRKSVMRGTYHFYTDDYKSSALWDDPTPILNSGCINVVEPNFSTNSMMPRAAVAWGVYRKRWMARYWQSQGVRVFVDLNVEDEFADLNWLGIPPGWRAYATRGYARHLDSLRTQYERACERGGGAALFVVVGGGAVIEGECRSRGWLYIPEYIHVAEGRRKDYGQE